MKLCCIDFAALTLVIIVCSFYECAPETLPHTAAGVPCYLRPSQDECHYKLKPGSNACTSASDRKRLNHEILLLNRTLTSFEQQLIRLGIIPPDNACSELPGVKNGGVVYDNLGLGPGATGRYICNEGYTLLSFRNKDVFTCTEDGIWDGNVTDAVQCIVSTGQCEFPGTEIQNGTIIYTDNDTANIMVGDIITYDCAVGTKLEGPSERFCMRTGNWSGFEPQCTDENPINKGKVSDEDEVIGAGVGSAIGVVLLIVVVLIAGIAMIYGFKLIRKRKRSGGSILSFIDDYDDIDDDDEVKEKKSKSEYSPITINNNATYLSNPSYQKDMTD